MELPQHCLGTVDGKHIAMKKPPNAGSYFYNYKGFHSIVLMAVADTTYKFLFVDVGAKGGASDGGTWSNSSLHDAELECLNQNKFQMIINQCPITSYGMTPLLSEPG